MMWKQRKKDLTFRQKVFGTVLILVLYRLLSHIPLPFVDSSYISAMINSNGSLSLLNTLTGGNLENMSVVALGITPFITASIILQLMGVLIPGLAEIQKDGSTGREKYKRITIILAVVFGGLQSLFMMIGYGMQGILSTYTWYSVLVPTVIMTAFVFVVAYAGQYISDHLFGNGVSLILLTGILCSYFADGQTLYLVLTYGRKLPYQVLYCGAACVVVFLLFGFTVWLNFCEKRVKVNYSGKAPNGAATKLTNVIPLKLIAGSVVPVIFASSILTIPALVQTFTKTDIKWLHVFNTSYWLSLDEWWANFGIALYFVMIIGFSYYYQSLNLNEREIADNLKRSGGSIIGVRPGRDTELYLRKHMRNLTCLGGIGLCVIAFVPILISHLLGISNLAFAGTSIIITVSVLDETYKKYKAEVLGTGYRRRRFYGKHRRKRRGLR